MRSHFTLCALAAATLYARGAPSPSSVHALHLTASGLAPLACDENGIPRPVRIYEFSDDEECDDETPRPSLRVAPVAPSGHPGKQLRSVSATIDCDSANKENVLRRSNDSSASGDIPHAVKPIDRRATGNTPQAPSEQTLCKPAPLRPRSPAPAPTGPLPTTESSSRGPSAPEREVEVEGKDAAPTATPSPRSPPAAAVVFDKTTGEKVPPEALAALRALEGEMEQLNAAKRGDDGVAGSDHERVSQARIGSIRRVLGRVAAVTVSLRRLDAYRGHRAFDGKNQLDALEALVQQERWKRETQLVMQYKVVHARNKGGLEQLRKQIGEIEALATREFRTGRLENQMNKAAIALERTSRVASRWGAAAERWEAVAAHGGAHAQSSLARVREFRARATKECDETFAHVRHAAMAAFERFSWELQAAQERLLELAADAAGLAAMVAREESERAGVAAEAGGAAAPARDADEERQQESLRRRLAPVAEGAQSLVAGVQELSGRAWELTSFSAVWFPKEWQSALGRVKRAMAVAGRSHYPVSPVYFKSLAPTTITLAVVKSQSVRELLSEDIVRQRMADVADAEEEKGLGLSVEERSHEGSPSLAPETPFHTSPPADGFVRDHPMAVRVDLGDGAPSAQQGEGGLLVSPATQPAAPGPRAPSPSPQAPPAVGVRRGRAQQTAVAEDAGEQLESAERGPVLPGEHISAAEWDARRAALTEGVGLISSCGQLEAQPRGNERVTRDFSPQSAPSDASPALADDEQLLRSEPPTRAPPRPPADGATRVENGAPVYTVKLADICTGDLDAAELHSVRASDDEVGERAEAEAADAGPAETAEREPALTNSTRLVRPPPAPAAESAETDGQPWHTRELHAEPQPAEAEAIEGWRDFQAKKSSILQRMAPRSRGAPGALVEPPWWELPVEGAPPRAEEAVLEETAYDPSRYGTPESGYDPARYHGAPEQSAPESAVKKPEQLTPAQLEGLRRPRRGVIAQQHDQPQKRSPSCVSKLQVKTDDWSDEELEGIASGNKNFLKESVRVHNQGDHKTCYAHAIASAVAALPELNSSRTLSVEVDVNALAALYKGRLGKSKVLETAVLQRLVHDLVEAAVPGASRTPEFVGNVFSRRGERSGSPIPFDAHLAAAELGAKERRAAAGGAGDEGRAGPSPRAVREHAFPGFPPSPGGAGDAGSDPPSAERAAAPVLLDVFALAQVDLPGGCEAAYSGGGAGGDALTSRKRRLAFANVKVQHCGRREGSVAARLEDSVRRLASTPGRGAEHERQIAADLRLFEEAQSDLAPGEVAVLPQVAFDAAPLLRIVERPFARSPSPALSADEAAGEGPGADDGEPQVAKIFFTDTNPAKGRLDNEAMLVNCERCLRDTDSALGQQLRALRDAEERGGALGEEWTEDFISDVMPPLPFLNLEEQVIEAVRVLQFPSAAGGGSGGSADFRPLLELRVSKRLNHETLVKSMVRVWPPGAKGHAIEPVLDQLCRIVGNEQRPNDRQLGRLKCCLEPSGKRLLDELRQARTAINATIEGELHWERIVPETKVILRGGSKGSNIQGKIGIKVPGLGGQNKHQFDPW